MCHFITLIAPTGDAAAVRAVMERHGRAATPVENASVRTILKDEEHQFLTTRGHCDCGTVLAARHDTHDGFEEESTKAAARMRRKGWSEAKITRAIENERKADARPAGGGPDSIELWNTVLRDLTKELNLPYAGLMVRFYSGSVATESFKASRLEAPKGVRLAEALASMEQDQVTLFPVI